MEPNLWGLHHLAYHQEQADWDHIARMGYRSAKPFEWSWNNAGYCANLLAAMPHDSILTPRNHPLSEQHDDMKRDPIGTGKRHADDWAEKLRSNQYHLPPQRSYYLGINEPHVWSHLQQTVQYTVAYLDRLKEHGLRGGALSLSVGWPATGPDTGNIPNWQPYQPVYEAIKRGGHILMLHEYGAHDQHGWGYWLMRLQHCPWRDVRIVIGECGIDEAVKPGKPHDGWRVFFDDPDLYADYLDDYHARLSADGRVHSAQIFTYDFSHPWATFDLRPARQVWESYPWTLRQPAAPLPGTGPTPTPAILPAPQQPAKVPALVHPVKDVAHRRITQPFGARPEYYKQFSLDGVPFRGHEGVDFATPIGLPIVAAAAGTVAEVADMGDKAYGKYIKVVHPWGESVYAHLSAQRVVVGATVAAGEVIGYSGNSGNTTGPHLHFGLRINPFDRMDGWGGFSDPARYLSTTTAPQPPPGQPGELLPLIKAAASEAGIDWQLLASLAWAESSFNLGAVSSAGAIGITQIMPATWREWSAKIGAGNDPRNPKDNLRVGARYLAWCIKEAGTVRKGLWAYVWGIGRVLEGRTPPAEVMEYANKIIHGKDLLEAIAK
jgi:hypothetical protein